MKLFRQNFSMSRARVDLHLDGKRIFNLSIFEDEGRQIHIWDGGKMIELINFEKPDVVVVVQKPADVSSRHFSYP